jgi:hypothetical protein
MRINLGAILASQLPTVLRIPPKSQCQVRVSHLHQTADMLSLLQTLNDPYVAPAELVAHLQRLPVLAGRCTRRAAYRAPKVRVRDLEHVLGLIGNQGVEAELLQLLEELTALKCSGQ